MTGTVLMAAYGALGMLCIYFGTWVNDGVWRSWAETRFGRRFPHSGLVFSWAGAGFCCLAAALAMGEVFQARRAEDIATTILNAVGGACLLVGVLGGLTRFPRRMVPRWLREYLDAAGRDGTA